MDFSGMTDDEIKAMKKGLDKFLRAKKKGKAPQRIQLSEKEKSNFKEFRDKGFVIGISRRTHIKGSGRVLRYIKKKEVKQ